MDKRKIFPWAQLPGELKNMVYDVCFTLGRPIPMTRYSYEPERCVRQCQVPPDNIGSCLNLLFVNKSTYAEGAPILYKNGFFFICEHAALSFVYFLSNTTKKWVQNVTIYKVERGPWGWNCPIYPDTSYRWAYNSPAVARKLKHLRIRIHTVEWVEKMAQLLVFCATEWCWEAGVDKGGSAAAADLIGADCRVMHSSNGSMMTTEKLQEELRKLLQAGPMQVLAKPAIRSTKPAHDAG